jgi:RNA:NAD 2'-phosphotransferase (TPT1/KptA family)
VEAENRWYTIVVGRSVSMILRHLPKEFSVAIHYSGSWVLEG